MPTFKVSVDNNTHEIDQSAIELPEGYQIIAPDTVPEGFVRQSVMNAKIDQRVKNAKENAKAEAVTDEAVRNQVLSEYGIELDDDGKPKGLDSSEVDLEKEREKWEKQNLSPVQDELEKATQKLGNLQNSTVKQSIRSAFAGKARDEYLDGEVGDPYVEQVFASRFKYNPDVGKTLLVDEEGNFEMHPNGKKANSHGYIEPDDYIKLNADTKLMKRILKDETQGGSDFNKGGSGGDSQTISREQFNQKDAKERQKIVSNGVKVVDD